MRAFFGSLIAVILLGLHGYAVWFAVRVVNCATATQGCLGPTKAQFTVGFEAALSTIGGLVSALVITELAVTKPGEAPVARVFQMEPNNKYTGLLKAVTGAYLIAWVTLGLWAFVVGAMNHPDMLQPLTDLGQSWLGLAVAAAYAYFGIKDRNG